MRPRVTVFATAAALCGVAIALASAPKDPRVVLVALAAGSAVFLALVLVLDAKRASQISARAIVVAGGGGLVARLILVPALPVLEDDVYRYLWDGAVVAEGISPYAYAPQEVYDNRLGREQPEMSAAQLEELAALAELSRRPALESVFLSINYPSVPTIYPPLSEGMFAGLSIAAPGSVVAMKIALIVLDAAAAIALLFVLVAIAAPRAWVLFYWLNPLILLSFAGSSHMDVLPMALLTGAVAVALRSRDIASGVLLGLACLAKLFPVVCWPAMRKELGVRGTVVFAFVLAGGTALLWHPRMFEGLSTFAQKWQINAAVHGLLAAVISQGAARVISGLLVGLTCLLVWRRDLVFAAMVAITALVLASPAVNPWYVAWIVPLAAATRSIPVLVLSLTVMASYARFITGEIPTWLQILEFGIPLSIAVFIHFRGRQMPQASENKPKSKTL